MLALLLPVGDPRAVSRIERPEWHAPVIDRGRARLAARLAARLVEILSTSERGSPLATDLPCYYADEDGCDGKVVAKLQRHGSGIEFYCDQCNRGGGIIDWRKTAWDRSRRSERLLTVFVTLADCASLLERSVDDDLVIGMVLKPIQTPAGFVLMGDEDDFEELRREVYWGCAMLTGVDDPPLMFDKAFEERIVAAIARAKEGTLEA